MKTFNYIVIGLIISTSQLAFGQLKITNQGFVGVGTNTPWERLHVFGGNFFIENNTSIIRMYPKNPYLLQNTTIGCNNGVMIFYDHTYGLNNVYASHFTQISDKRLKDEIQEIKNPIEILKQLKGVHYKFINTGPSANGLDNSFYDYGFIAQDVEKVLPEIVSTIGSDSSGIAPYKGINYNAIIPFLVEGFKLQQNVVDSLQHQIDSLTIKLDACCNSSSLRTSNNTGGGPNDGFLIENGTRNLGKLFQNQPNPFKETTIIKYEINDANATAQIMIFDMQGTLIKTISLIKSTNGSVSINGNELKPGMYLYSLIINNKEIDTKRMIITE